MNELSTVKKRESIVAALICVASRHGAIVERDECISRDREIYLRIRLAQYYVAISLDRDSNCGAFLGHWNTDHNTTARFPKDFGFTVQGSVNEYHYGKATTCVETLVRFYAAIEAGLTECAKLSALTEAA